MHALRFKIGLTSIYYTDLLLTEITAMPAKKKPHCGLSIILAAFLLICLIKLPALSADLPAVTTALEQQKALGFEMIQQGDSEGAYELFMRLLREEPADEEINWGLGRAAENLGKYSQSMMAYERMSIFLHFATLL